jgi:hypothetical protein
VSTPKAGRRHSALNTQAIRAELAGSDRCSAADIAVRAPLPILKMCRRLIEAGHDRRRNLVCYRGDTLALTISSIGHGARLEINAKDSGFVRHRAVRPTPPICQNQRGAA